jgi:hypothetical protein
VGVKSRLDAPHDASGACPPLQLNKGSHVAACAVLTLQDHMHMCTPSNTRQHLVNCAMLAKRCSTKLAADEPASSVNVCKCHIHPELLMHNTAHSCPTCNTVILMPP